ncbi:hypothetical protein [Brachybacterium squillarum]|uniref:hypothetical protein n=1 Tax=Brachybacterium squillarum TaxID=661979 RepID=UPI0002629E15|nr:hypothetical protein [Brachybacterium squillarum]
MTTSQPSPSAPDSADAPTSPASPAEAPAESTAVYVRRRRTPSLLTWVLLALVVPVVIGFLGAPLLGITDAGSMLNLGLLAGLFIGVPLAALACLVEAIAQRRR